MSSRWGMVLGALLLVVLTAWGARHVYAVVHPDLDPGHRFTVVYAVAFVILCWQTVLALSERPYVTSAEQAQALDQLRVVANVPIYNEDPAALKETIASLLDQTRLPQVIHAVNDGSTQVDYAEVRAWAETAAAERGVELTWYDKPNGGKRSAQVVTFSSTPEADIYLTVDSDAVLDERALEEGLKPFADPEVTSVAGVVQALNNRANLLARLTDLWFVMGQMTDRSSLSTMGSVLVNSGPLALYRAQVVRDHLHTYASEEFLGRRVEFSDDSMLTLFCLCAGKTVQQPTAFAFTLMPETLDHHLRQYLRWMRGAFIRSFWRFRYLPTNRYAYWAHLAGWVQTLVSLWVFIALFVVGAARDPGSVPPLLLIPVLVGYGQALRYFSARRSDEPTWSRVLTVVLSPLASLWAFFGLRLVRLYAIATCRRTGWGTRESVEVALARPVGAS